MPTTTPGNVEVCVVGAGPHGLAVTTHLLSAQPSLRGRISVVDPSGEWLATWSEQFERLEIGVLRSPVVHHPAVAPGALASYTNERRLPRSNLPYDPPLRSVFESFCTDSIDRYDIASLPSAGTVQGLTPGTDAEPAVVITSEGELRARHVVWCGNPSRPQVPPAIGSDPEAVGAVLSAGVDLRTISSLEGAHVVVVGGGLTAGHLVMGARSRGARVTLIARRPLVERDFDVEPGWLGPKHLDGYLLLADPQRRLDTARSARGGGSVPGWMRRRICAEVDAGAVRLVIGAIDHAAARGDGTELVVNGEAIVADQCWLATGTIPDSRADAALGPAVEATVDHLNGIPVVDRDLRLPGTNVFVTGRLATTELGPAAGNLWGARMAARAISRAITSVDLDADAMTVIEPPSTRPTGAA